MFFFLIEMKGIAVAQADVRGKVMTVTEKKGEIEMAGNKQKKR